MIRPSPTGSSTGVAEVRQWHDAGAPIHRWRSTSAKSLRGRRAAEDRRGAEKWGVDPRFLKIEITESSIMADPAHALAILSMLQSMGVRLSIDDFGTGYSSLTHLRELPVDEIKIDKSFVIGMGQAKPTRRSSAPSSTSPRTSASRSAPKGSRPRRRGSASARWDAISRRVTGLPASPALTDRWLAENDWGLKLKTATTR